MPCAIRRECSQCHCAHLSASCIRWRMLLLQRHFLVYRCCRHRGCHAKKKTRLCGCVTQRCHSKRQHADLDPVQLLPPKQTCHSQGGQKETAAAAKEAVATEGVSDQKWQMRGKTSSWLMSYHSTTVGKQPRHLKSKFGSLFVSWDARRHLQKHSARACPPKDHPNATTIDQHGERPLIVPTDSWVEER